jgi:hypothetical protein
MPDISKINAVAVADIEKLDSILAANIEKVNGLTFAAGGGLLLDIYTDGLMAVSVRKLRSAYTGDCMRVRESGTDTEVDIGFDTNGLVDTAAIASHCTSNDGFVTTWYTQIGSNNPGTATYSVQIKIYDGATQAVLLDNGLPTTSFTTGYFPLNGDRTGSITTAIVIHANDTRYAVHGDFNIFEAKEASTAINVPTSTIYVNNNAENPTTEGQLWTALTQDPIVLVHNEDVSTSLMGTGGTVNRYTGFMQEMIVWNSVKNATDRAGIQENINDYFSIY